MQIARTVIETNDIDAYPKLERALGWKTEKSQLSGGHGAFRYVQLTVGELTIWRYHSPQKVYHSYTIDRGIADFVFFRNSVGTIWCGQPLPSAASLAQRSGGALWATTPEDAILFGLYVPRRFASEWVLMPSQIRTVSKMERSGVLIATTRTNDELLDCFDRCLSVDPDEAESRSQMSADLHDDIRRAMQRYLEVCIPASDLNLPAQTLGRASLVEEARNVVTSNLERPLTAAEIADELCVSRRVLELGFKEVLGMPPYRFIINQKLNAARRMLMRGGCSIRQVCDRFGFANAGRFSKMYRELFDELPSKTLSAPD